MLAEPGEIDVRVFGDRTVEMGGGDQLAEVCITGIVLRQERQPIERERARDPGRPSDRQERSDDRLDAFGKTGVAERHRRVKAVAVGKRDCREAQLCRPLGDRLWLHRPFEHGE